MISRKEYKKAKEIVKEYEKQSSIVVDLLCDHDWDYISVTDEQMICLKCYETT